MSENILWVTSQIYIFFSVALPYFEIRPLWENGRKKKQNKRANDIIKTIQQ